VARAGHSSIRNRQSPIYRGSLSEGFTFTPPSGLPIYLFTDGELFGWRRPEARLHARLTAEAPEAAYADLQSGDWVVHVDHGVGKFLGLFRRTMESIERDYLAVEYADGDQLYVPVYQADRLTRYVGPENRARPPRGWAALNGRPTRPRPKRPPKRWPRIYSSCTPNARWCGLRLRG